MLVANERHQKTDRVLRSTNAPNPTHALCHASCPLSHRYINIQTDSKVEIRAAKVEMCFWKGEEGGEGGRQRHWIQMVGRTCHGNTGAQLRASALYATQALTHTVPAGSTQSAGPVASHADGWLLADPACFSNVCVRNTGHIPMLPGFQRQSMYMASI